MAVITETISKVRYDRATSWRLAAARTRVLILFTPGGIEDFLTTASRSQMAACHRTRLLSKG
jgi:hypothetical protein